MPGFCKKLRNGSFFYFVLWICLASKGFAACDFARRKNVGLCIYGVAEISYADIAKF